jgi:hypothetical protein
MRLEGLVVLVVTRCGLIHLLVIVGHDKQQVNAL